jgi:hypothetical protein
VRRRRVRAESASTGLVQGISTSGGTLTAVVDPHGPAGAVRFEYGGSTAYGSQTDTQALAAGFGNRTAAAAVSGFPAGTEVHYRVVLTTPDGTSTGADATFTTATATAAPTTGGGGPTGTVPVVSRDTVAPRLTRLSPSATRFAVTPKPTGSRQRTRNGIRLGTTFRLRLSEAGTVRFAFAVRTTVHKGKRKIVHFVAKGALQRTLRAGARVVPFTGWIGRRALKPGTDRVGIQASDAAGNRSKVTTLTFTIVRVRAG